MSIDETTLAEIRTFLETSPRGMTTAALIRTGLQLLAEVERLRAEVAGVRREERERCFNVVAEQTRWCEKYAPESRDILRETERAIRALK